MRVLYAYNQHRGGGGADNAARATIAVSRQFGLDVEVYTRSSEDLPRDLGGRLRAGVSAVFPPTSVRSFAALLDVFRPDVVHVHEVFPLVSPWILPQCTQRKIPVVMTTVDYRLTCPVGTHLRDGAVCHRCTGGHEYWAVLENCRHNLTESIAVTLYNTIARRLRLFAAHVSRFVAPSEFTRRWLIAHADIPPERITTISPVVNIPDRGVDPAAGRYVGYASRFSPEKGIATLLEAARASTVPFRLSRHESSLVNVELPAGTDVMITRDKAQLDEFYRGARMLVVPSIWFETFGLVGAEAMSHGVPVIASRIGALEELIEDGVDGLLVTPQDPQELVRAVARLWADPQLARRLGRAAREKAAARWNPRRHFDQHHAVYEQLCPR